MHLIGIRMSWTIDVYENLFLTFEMTKLNMKILSFEIKA